jgi:hypothetical protein
MSLCKNILHKILVLLSQIILMWLRILEGKIMLLRLRLLYLGMYSLKIKNRNIHFDAAPAPGRERPARNCSGSVILSFYTSLVTLYF